jgi:hypothetical protein
MVCSVLLFYKIFMSKSSVSALCNVKRYEPKRNSFIFASTFICICMRTKPLGKTDVVCATSADTIHVTQKNEIILNYKVTHCERSVTVLAALPKCELRE